MDGMGDEEQIPLICHSESCLAVHHHVQGYATAAGDTVLPFANWN